MKRIVILIPTIKAGGAERQAALLAVELAKNHHTYFVSFYGHVQESMSVRKILEQANVKIIFLEGNLFSKIAALYRLLKKNKIEICFNYITLCDVLGCFVERFAGVKYIYNGIRNSRLAPIKLISEWLAHNFVADYTIYNSYSGARNFEKKGFKRNKTIVIPNCFPNISNPIFRDKVEKKVIITIARFQPQKDYETAIRAIAEVKKSHDNFEYIIIGHGYYESKIRRWLKEYMIDDCSKLFIAPPNVQEILKSADIYLSTSLFEGTSNSIMEAMNWSIPVVATNVGDNNQLIRNDWNGFLTDVGDYKTMAKYIVKLLDNNQCSIEMGLHGNELLHQYSTDIFVKNYSNLLK